jgi:radical SAM superfamily enzyme YgiQ (UPF0313 family)
MGTTVVMGGVHASALPEEAAEHCDSVVIGEGENMWPRVLEDFMNGQLEKFYKNSRFVDVNAIPFARRDLLVKDQYITTNIIQASRGCPYKCEFCSVSEMFGTRTRLRSIARVIEEIKGMDDKALIFADDNLAINTDYSRELFTQMIPLKKVWTGEASWTIADHPDLLDIMKQSGCVGLLIGFESIRPQDNVRKMSNQKTMKELYVEAIKKIHDKGLIVFGTFIFGFDNDDERVFGETMEFINRADIEYVSVAPLVPYPGTPLYRRLLNENRVIVKDWRNYIYNPPGICFEPRNLTRSQIRENLRRMYLEAYSFKRLLLLTIRMLKRYRKPVVAVRLLIIAIVLRRRNRFRWHETSEN